LYIHVHHLHIPYLYLCRDKLASNPPTQLLQDYYSCYPDMWTTLETAAGVAAGNTSLVFPIVLLLLLPLLNQLLKCWIKVPTREEYKKADIEAAGEVMSVMLLRLRDDKHDGMIPNGVLMQLYKEVREAALMHLSLEHEGRQEVIADSGQNSFVAGWSSSSRSRTSERLPNEDLGGFESVPDGKHNQM
jgi:hypothetical protein